MVTNEPSDRQDRRIQRRKMREMWLSLDAEKARLAALPVRDTHMVHYVGRDMDAVDNSFVRRVYLAVGAVLIGLAVLAYSV